jgi:cytochrome c oxidase subunit 2
MPRLLYRWTGLLMGLWLVGCHGPQSALEPAGRAAESIADLFWWMMAGAAVIWLVVVSIALYVMRIRPEAHGQRFASWLIIGGGAILPTLTLAALLAYGLAMMPDLLAPPSGDHLQIAVSGEQWWWRVRYPPPDGGEGSSVELANELRLPVGVPVRFAVEIPDVVHSFWIPSLGGKIDMIPGRTNLLTLEPTRTGVFRGVCAEYCGTSHALMALDVVVLEKHEHTAWLQRQREPAQMPEQAEALRGQDLFIANGCGACHTVRGTLADGTVGPDLTHVGSRVSLGAGTLPNDLESLIRWMAHTETVKPGVHMPAFGMLPSEDLRALAIYLDGLK